MIPARSRGAVTGTRLWNWGWVTTRSLRVFCSRPFFRIGGDRFRPDGNNEVITVTREDISWIFMEESRRRQFRISHLPSPSCFSLSLTFTFLLILFFRSYAYFTFLSPASLSNIYLLLHLFHLAISLSLSLQDLPNFSLFHSFSFFTSYIFLLPSHLAFRRLLFHSTFFLSSLLSFSLVTSFLIYIHIFLSLRV